jgi:hypothetical protein
MKPKKSLLQRVLEDLLKWQYRRQFKRESRQRDITAAEVIETINL